jgi:isoleucyl-tRNA synthetase
MGFVDDLSTWYLRRSRDRFKSDDLLDKALALRTTRFVLREFAKIAAPIIPFYTEYLYGRVKGADGKESVHLEAWPDLGSADEKVIESMAEVRRIVTMGLEQRAKANIKVRQPLAKLSIRASKLTEEFLCLIQDEMNVKAVVIDPSIEMEAFLDAHVTDELRREGIIRDLIRAIQELRKTTGLTVGDKVMLLLDSDQKGKELVQEYIHDIKKVTLVTGVEYAVLSDIPESKIEEFTFKISLKR